MVTPILVSPARAGSEWLNRLVSEARVTSAFFTGFCRQPALGPDTEGRPEYQHRCYYALPPHSGGRGDRLMSPSGRTLLKLQGHPSTRSPFSLFGTSYICRLPDPQAWSQEGVRLSPRKSTGCRLGQQRPFRTLPPGETRHTA